MTIICGNCGAELPDGLKFCSSCGTKIEPAPAVKAPRKRASVKTEGKPAATKAVTPRRAKASPHEPPVEIAPEAETAPEVATDTPLSPTPVCLNCREPNAPDARFCRHCGAAMDGSAAAPMHLASGTTAYQPPFNGYGAPPEPNRTPWIVAAALLGVLIIGFLYYTVFLDREAPDTPAVTNSSATPLPSSTVKVEEQYFVVADANIRDRATSIGTRVVRKENRGSMLRGTVEIGEDGRTQWLKLSDNSGFVALSNLSSNQPPRLAQTFNNRPFTSAVDVPLHAAPDDSSPVLETMPYGKSFFLAGITDNGFIEAKRAKGGVGYFSAAGVDLSGNYVPAVNPAADSAMYAGDDYAYDGSRGISADYLANFRSLVGQAGDQRITITIHRDGGGVAYYTNINSGKTCTAYLRYTGVYNSYLGFNQSRPGDGSGCGQTPELRIFGNPGGVEAEWVMGDSAVMSSSLSPGR